MYGTVRMRTFWAGIVRTLVRICQVGVGSQKRTLFYPRGENLSSVSIFLGSLSLALLLLAPPLLPGSSRMQDLYQVQGTQRDPFQVRIFRRMHPCPATGRIHGPCPGYVVDHVIPLCLGGADHPSNMQWQRRGESLKKDKLEREACARRRR